MPDFQGSSPENQETVSGKKPRRRRKRKTTTESNNAIKTVRIFCHDPDMTDSSDDDGPSCKTIVQEIKIPVTHFPATASYQDSNNSNKKLQKFKKGLTRMKSQRPVTSRSKYPGVRLRDSGNWGAEIRDPVKKTRVWLGTFSTPELASRAYEIKKLEFEKRAESLTTPIKNPNFPAAGGETPVGSNESLPLIKHPSPSSVLETESCSFSRIFINNDRKMEPLGLIDDEFNGSGLGFVEPVDEGLSLAEISNDLDFELELGTQFLDNVIAPLDGLDGFGCVDDMELCRVDDGGFCGLPDWDFGELKNEELGWINTFRTDEFCS